MGDGLSAAAEMLGLGAAGAWLLADDDEPQAAPNTTRAHNDATAGMDIK